MQNGRSLFDGAAKAVFYGGISSIVSFGIGSAATSLFSNKIAQAAFQAVAHGLTGGAMAELQGGKFKHGLASGMISSVVSSGANALGQGPEIMIAAGGLSGGLGSWATGGSFWDGLRQGLITSALNHAMHGAAESIHSDNDKGKLKLAEALAKKHGGTTKEWYDNLGDNSSRGNGILQIEFNFNLSAAFGVEGSIGMAFANDGIGIYGSLGPSWGSNMSLGASAILSKPILKTSKLSIFDVNGAVNSYGLGAGPFSIGWGRNTTLYGPKFTPTLNYKSIGLSIGQPVSYTFSNPTSKLFLKF